MTERDGKYEKRANEDLESIVAGILGFKGRVHVNFAKPLHGNFDNVEALATKIDRLIALGIEPYPTYQEAEDRLTRQETVGGLQGTVAGVFEDALEQLPDDQRPFLLLQYANQFRNKRDLFTAGD